MQYISARIHYAYWNSRFPILKKFFFGRWQKKNIGEGDYDDDYWTQQNNLLSQACECDKYRERDCSPLNCPTCGGC